MPECTLQDVRQANYDFDCGLGLEVCKRAVIPANELFGGDALKGLLYISADGYSISVGNGLSPELRRAARLRWNRDHAESHADRLRQRAADALQD